MIFGRINRVKKLEKILFSDNEETVYISVPRDPKDLSVTGGSYLSLRKGVVKNFTREEYENITRGITWVTKQD